MRKVARILVGLLAIEPVLQRLGLSLPGYHDIVPQPVIDVAEIGLVPDLHSQLTVITVNHRIGVQYRRVVIRHVEEWRTILIRVERHSHPVCEADRSEIAASEAEGSSTPRVVMEHEGHAIAAGRLCR